MPTVLVFSSVHFFIFARSQQIKHWRYGGRFASYLLSEKWFCSLPQTKLFFPAMSITRLLRMVTTCCSNFISFFGGCPYLSFKTYVLMGEACLQRWWLLAATNGSPPSASYLPRQGEREADYLTHITLTKELYPRTTLSSMPDGVRTSHILLRKLTLYPRFSLPKAGQGACPLGPSSSFRITRIHREVEPGVEAFLE